MKISNFQAKKCVTVAGLLLVEGKVLLIKHKKLGIWLAPGGHIEADELPHQAVEREFFEETGLKVMAVASPMDGEDSEYLPNPILTNLHWISQDNYHARLNNPDNYIKASQWKKGCEQHLCFIYLVKAVGSVDFKQNEVETLGIDWFGPEEIADLETTPDIKAEINYVFKNYV